MSQSTCKSRKLALLLGIDRYRYLPFRNLRGCSNDVAIMEKLLRERFDFPAESIIKILNEDATRENILGAMRRLAVGVESDDIVVLFYAGHGSRMRDREGNKPTNMDETLVPYDSGRGRNPNLDITDDELQVWLRSLTEKTPYTTLVFDCCHSGSMTRDAFGDGIRSGPSDYRPVSQLPPSPISSEILGGLHKPADAVCILPRSDRYVVLSACRDEEDAYEYTAIEGKDAIYHGTFSYFLIREISAQNSTRLTYRDLFERVASAVTSERPQQHPSCEGSLDRLLFGTGALSAGCFVQVPYVEGTRVLLAGGAAHGVVVDSEWDLYPPGTQQQGIPELPSGRCVVTAVSSLTAQAKLIGESTKIKAPARAVEVQRPEGRGKWIVDLAGVPDESQRLSLERLFADSILLQPANGHETAHCRIYRIPARDVLAEDSPAPQLGRLPEPVWAIVGREGQPHITMLARDSVQDDLPLLRDRLTHIVRYEHVRALRCPGARMETDLKFSLLRKSSSATWECAKQDRQGRYLCRNGDTVAIELENTSKQPLYISVLALGIDRSIEQIYPPPGALSQMFEPERPCLIGDWTIRFPPEPPGVSFCPCSPDAALDVLKLLITDQLVDFGPLFQPGIRGGTFDWYKSPLGRRLARSLGRFSARGEPSREQVPEHSWATVTREIILCR